MPDLSLTDFVEIVSAAGTTKYSKVRQIKHRPPYHPAFDFYKPFRDHVVELHRAGHPKRRVPDVLPTLTDTKKQTTYPELVNEYTRWWGRKTLGWFEPARDHWSGHGIDVRVNPELGLEVNGVPHVIKLYFKPTALAKPRVQIILHLMDATLAQQSPPNAVMAILDVRRNRLITCGATVAGLNASLLGELAYIAAIWPTA